MSTKHLIELEDSARFAIVALTDLATKAVANAYAKMRNYKAQHAQLVSRHRLLKLEYKELKSKYDRLLEEHNRVVMSTTFTDGG